MASRFQWRQSRRQQIHHSEQYIVSHPVNGHQTTDQRRLKFSRAFKTMYYIYNTYTCIIYISMTMINVLLQILYRAAKHQFSGINGKVLICDVNISNPSKYIYVYCINIHPSVEAHTYLFSLDKNWYRHWMWKQHWWGHHRYSTWMSAAYIIHHRKRFSRKYIMENRMRFVYMKSGT